MIPEPAKSLSTEDFRRRAALLRPAVRQLGQSLPAAHHEAPPLAEQPAVPPAELPPGIARDYDQYLLFKEGLQNAYGIQYAIEAAVLPQWAETSATNFVYTPWISWTRSPTPPSDRARSCFRSSRTGSDPGPTRPRCRRVPGF